MVIIRIFVSSKTDELRAERAMIKRSLENLSDDIDVFIFEKDAGSRTDSSEVVYRTEVIDRNIYIGLFDDIYSKATEEEYHLAQNHNKESHIYIRDSPGANRDKNLKSLLKVIREKNTYSTFVSIEDLETKVRDDIMRLLITKFSVSIITTELDEFTFIGPSYFVTHQKDNFQQWKIGFPFNLVAINNGRELKRTRIVKEVIDRLDKNKLQIILARSGYSKTTILDEIICEYVSRNYKVFSIDGTIPLLNPNKTIAGIEKVLETGKQILIAVDNAHTSKIASIYYIIDRILSHNLSNNIRFILTCRLPDFEKLQKVEGTDYLEYVNKYYRSPFQYLLPAFDKQDIKEFLLKYKTASKSKFQLKTPVMKLACSLLDETNGNPMLVRFKVMNTGLKEHVNFMKNEYLKAEDDLITTIACCLLDLSEIKITDKLLKDLGLFDFAYLTDRQCH